MLDVYVDRVILGPKIWVGWSVGKLKNDKILKTPPHTSFIDQFISNRYPTFCYASAQIATKCNILTEL